MKKLFLLLTVFFTITTAAQTNLNGTTLTIKKNRIDSLNATGVLSSRNASIPTDSTVLLAITRSTGTNVSGGVVTWVSGLTFTVTAADYVIKNRAYKSNAGNITLDAAHSTFNRLDVIALNTSGQIIKITGTPSATPAIPQVNPATQFYLTAVLVYAGATTPAITQRIIYDENTEWTGDASGFTSSNFANTTTPQNGSVCIALTGSGGIKMSDGANTYPYSDYNVLRFYIRLVTALPAAASVSIGLGNGTEALTPLTAANGFNSTLTGTWQNISIPLNQLQKSSNTFAAFYVDVVGVTTTYRIDNIVLQGSTGGGTGNGYVSNVYKKPGTDSVFQVINGVHLYAFTDGGGGGGSITLNGQTGATQNFDVGSAGTNFNITSSGNTHTFNIPNASVSNSRGLVTNSTQAFAGVKQFNNSINITAANSYATGIFTHMLIQGVGDVNTRIGTSSDSSAGRSMISFVKGNGIDDFGWRIGQNSSFGQNGHTSYDFSINEYQYLPGTNIPRLVLQRRTGNIGIGTFTPASKLDVAGTGNFSSSLTIPTEIPADSSAKAASTAFAKRMLAESAFDVIRPTTTGTVSPFDKLSSTQLRISDLKNSATVTWTKDGDGNVIATAAGGGGSTAIGSTVTGATAGRIALFGTNNLLQQNAALLFDSTAGRLQANVFRGSAADGDVIIEKGDGTRAFRGVTFTGWTDAAAATHFQVGEFSQNIIFAARQSSRINRLMLNAGTTHLTSTTDYSTAPVPTGILQVDDGTTPLFNIDENRTRINTGVAFSAKQTITSGTSTTVANNVYNVFVNPASVLASHTITLTASPVDGTEINIFFGGTVAAGSAVVTSLTISANAGQTLYQALTPTTANGGDVVTYVYNNTVWYRKK